MKTAINISSVFTGKTQAERKLPALDPAYFAIDERDTADLIAFTVKFSKALTYFNLENQPQGSWQQLLLSDIIMLTAYIMKTDTSQSYAKYEDYRNGIMSSRNWPMRRLMSQQFFSIGFHILLRINRWYQLSNQTLTSHAFRDFLHNFIEEEARPALREYYLIYFTLCERLHFKNEALSKLEDLDLIWLFDPFPILPPLKATPPKRESIAKANARKEKQLIRLIDAAMESGQKLFHLQDQIIKQAGTYFHKALEKQDISPHIGLLLSFLDLLKHQQAEINGLTKSHLDFYYQSILGFKPLPPLSDSCFLSFQLASGKKPFVIPIGTAFSAGTGLQSTPISFLTEKELKVTAATLKKYQCQNIITSKEGDKTYIDKIEIEDIKNFDQLKAESWPLFGTNSAIPASNSGTTLGSISDTPPKGNAISGTSDSIGLAISCPDLILNGGERKITFTFDGAPGTISPIPKPVPIGDADCQPQPKTLEHALLFALTTPKGWQAFSATALQLDFTTNTLVFSLNLSLGTPAIVSYNPKIHGPGYDTDWPICKINLAPKVEQEYFKWLSNLQLQAVTIKTQVSGNQQLVLQGNKGKISPTVPFPPFGMAPLPSSTLYLGGQEFFVKPLTELTLNLIWEPIPSDLALYYKDYPGDYQNEAFRASLSASDGEGNWKHLETDKKQVRFGLFTVDGTDPITVACLPPIVPISNPRIINFPLPTGLHVDPNLPNIINYSPKTSPAFLKLSFDEPQQGFGNQLYPKVLSNITLENSQAIVSNATQCTAEGAVEPIANVLKEIQASLANIDKTAWSVYNNKTLLEQSNVEVCQLIQTGQTKSSSILAIKTLIAQEQKLIIQNLTSAGHTIKEAIQKTEALHKQFFEKILPKVLLTLKSAQKKKVKKAAKDFLEKLKKEFGSWGILHEVEKLLQGLFGMLTNGGISRLWKRKAKKGDKQKALPAGSSSGTPSDLPKLEQKIASINNAYQQFLLDLETMDINKVYEKLKALHSSIDQNLVDFIHIICKEAKRKLELSADFYEVLIVIICPAYTPLKPLPNKPFLPKLQHLKVDYTSSSHWNNGNGAAPFFKMYRLIPNGIQPVSVGDKPIKFFPHYQEYPYAFLGLTQLTAGDTITILFSITSQLKYVDSYTGQRIKYEYLTENGWQLLLLSADSTFGFEQSGIVTFVVPTDMTDTSTLMATGYYWLRLTNLENRDITTNFVATQAVSVRREIQPDSTISPIAIGTIKSSLKPIAAIKKIIQPIASSGGRGGESIQEMNQRTAYRLKNKKRALTPDDIEDVVLQQFPNLYKATAVPMGYFDLTQTNVLKLTIVPFARKADENRYRPLVSPKELRSIWNQLQKQVPVKTDLQLVNPSFITLRIKVNVVFETTDQDGLLIKQLNEDIINFLSPWVEDNPFYGQQPAQWTSAAIQAFIQARSSVKSVNFFCYQLDGNPAFSDKSACQAPTISDHLQVGDLLVPCLDNIICVDSDTVEVSNNSQNSTNDWANTMPN